MVEPEFVRHEAYAICGAFFRKNSIHNTKIRKQYKITHIKEVNNNTKPQSTVGHSSTNLYKGKCDRKESEWKEAAGLIET